MSKNNIIILKKLSNKIIPDLSFVIMKYIDPFMTLSKEQKERLLKYKHIVIFPDEYSEDNILDILKNTDNINDFIVNIFSCPFGCMCKYEIQYMDINNKIGNLNDNINIKKFKVKLFDQDVNTCLIHTITILNKLDHIMKSIIEHIFDIKFEYIIPTGYIRYYNTDSDTEKIIETYDDQCYDCDQGIGNHIPELCKNYAVIRIPKDPNDKMIHKIMSIIDTFFDNE